MNAFNTKEKQLTMQLKYTKYKLLLLCFLLESFSQSRQELPYQGQSSGLKHLYFLVMLL